jgi:hypothetical protein
VNLALLGGYHQMEVSGSNKHIIYPGSPQPLQWTDTSIERGPLLISVVNNHISTGHIEIPHWSLNDVTVTVEGCHTVEDTVEQIEQELERLGLGQGELVARVRLAGKPIGDFALSDIQEALTTDAKVILESAFTFPYDLDHLAQEQTVRGMLIRYVQDQINASSDANERNKLLNALQIALTALDGRQVHPDAVR